MYMLVIYVLSLALAFPSPLYEAVRAPMLVLAAAVVAMLLPLLVMIPCMRMVRAQMERFPDRPDYAQTTQLRSIFAVQLLLGLLYTALYLFTDWLAVCALVPGLGRVPGVAGVLASVPFVLDVLCIWALAFPNDRALRQIGLEISLFRSRPVHPVWQLGEYLLFNFRTQVLSTWIPMSMIVVARDVVDHYNDAIRKLAGGQHSLRPGVVSPGTYLPDLLLGTIALSVAVLAPAMVRYVWETRPLPAGPLRDRLLSLCQRLRMRCREILVWRSGGRLVNAAVMGLLAPIRYILITDAMLEQMEDVKIEAVFGHEAGHVKRHHIFFFLVFAFVTGCVVTVIGAIRPQMRETAYYLVVGIGGAVLAFKWFFMFGWLSRQFERQADVYGVRTLMLAGLPCQGDCAVHAPSAGARLGDPLCRSAVEVFSATLNDVAALNGISPDTPSWRHPSISARSRFLQGLALDPVATARFEQFILWVKRGLLLAAALSAVASIYFLRLWTLLGL